MQSWGTTRAGTPRFFCRFCKKSVIWGRDDLTKKHTRDQFVSWLSGERSEREIAEKLGISRRALYNRFHPFFQEPWECVIPHDLSMQVLIVDGTYIEGNTLCVLVALADTGHLFWHFAMRETGLTWHVLLSRIPAPSVVVCDGQKGLERVLRHLWPDTRMQRCHFHMVAFGIQKLTRKPRTSAGKDILVLLHGLKDVGTKEEKDRWILLFRLWEKQYHAVLTGKTEQGGYANRNLRSVRSLIRHALPDLFTYLEYHNVPNTTNLVEGWVNTRIAEGIRQHRGLSPSQKKTLVAIILRKLSAEKPTRKFS